jgi:hypothetical protein
MVEPSGKSQRAKGSRFGSGLRQTRTDLLDEVLAPESLLKKRL